MGLRGSSYRRRRLYRGFTCMYIRRGTLFSTAAQRHAAFQSRSFLTTSPSLLHNGNALLPTKFNSASGILTRAHNAMIYNDIEPVQQHIECMATRVISSSLISRWNIVPDATPRWFLCYHTLLARWAVSLLVYHMRDSCVVIARTKAPLLSTRSLDDEFENLIDPRFKLLIFSQILCW